MVRAEAEVSIDSPCEQVFGSVAVSFPANDLRWSPEVKVLETLSEGPVQVGWLARQVRVDRGRRSDRQSRLTTFEPGCRISFEGTTVPYRIDCQFDSLPGQTRIRFSRELTELSVARYPFRKAAAKAVQEISDPMVERLETLVESELTRID